MKKVYENLDGVEVVYDDILVHGSTQKEHDKRLIEALARSRKAGVKLNTAKCMFGLPEVTYLGRVISGNGVRSDKSKVADILDMPRPTDKTGVLPAESKPNTTSNLRTEVSAPSITPRFTL